MIRFVTRTISLATCLGTLAIGGFLCVAGGVSRPSDIALNGLLSQPLFGTDVSAEALLFQTFEVPQEWLEAVSAPGLTFGFLLVGLALVFVGFRGLWRRLSSGRGEANARLARGRADRIGRMSFYGVAFLLGLLGLTLGLLDLAGPAKLFATGQGADAVIERKWQPIRGGSDAGAFISYVFETEGGARVYGSTWTPLEFAHRISEGDAVELIYDPGNPSITVFPGRYGATELFVYFATRLFLIWLGLSGLRRTLKRYRRRALRGRSFQS